MFVNVYTLFELYKAINIVSITKDYYENPIVERMRYSGNIKN